MNDNCKADEFEEKKLPFGWVILGGLVLWGLFGVTFYTIGSMLRAAMIQGAL